MSRPVTRPQYPVEPVNVRLVDQAGHEHPVQCVFERWDLDDGPPIAVWVVVDAPPGPFTDIRCGVFPGRSRIVVEVGR
jgi:hypothetical protein